MLSSGAAAAVDRRLHQIHTAHLHAELLARPLMWPYAYPTHTSHRVDVYYTIAFWYEYASPGIMTCRRFQIVYQSYGGGRYRVRYKRPVNVTWVSPVPAPV